MCLMAVFCVLYLPSYELTCVDECIKIELIINFSLSSHYITKPQEKSLKVYFFINVKAFLAVSTSGAERRLKCVAEVK